MPPVPFAGEAKPWHKKAWIWVTGIAIVISWVLLNGIAALSNAERLPSAISGLHDKISTWYHIDQEWTGKWTNEGDLDARYQPDIYVDLDLLVQERIATFKITRIGSDDVYQIKLATTWQVQSWFPEETTLWRNGETELLPKEASW